MTNPSLAELPPGVQLVYLAEGGANVIYRFVVAPAKSSLVVQDANDPVSRNTDIFQVNGNLDDIRSFNSWGLMIVIKPGQHVFEYDLIFNEAGLDLENANMLAEQNIYYRLQAEMQTVQVKFDIFSLTFACESV